MSESEREYNSDTQYSEPVIQPEEEIELPAEDPDFAARIEARRNLTRRTSVRKKKRRTVLMILVFAVLLTMCSREIMRLKAENTALKRQHAQLELERDRLTKELSQVNNKEYIKEQARRQLRLLDPGEKMFVFEDDSQKGEDPETEEEEESEESKSSSE